MWNNEFADKKTKRAWFVESVLHVVIGLVIGVLFGITIGLWLCPSI